MKKIFINGMNSKTAGGKSILSNFLTLLSKRKNSNNVYYILTPNYNEYKHYNDENINIIDISNLYKKSIFSPFTTIFILPNLIKKLGINLVFNLSDIPIPTKVKQIFLFDWSYAVYPESKVWKMMDMKSFLVRKTKLNLFKRYIKYSELVIAQTETMKDKLEGIYNLKNIKVIPNAVSLENLSIKENFDFSLPTGVKLLYLSYYYPHKNIEILLPLAKRIKEKKLDYKLVITIDEKQHKNAKKLLDDISKKKLDKIIVNIGSVEMTYVPSLYTQCDGLLMPTLLESFSGTYVEAMFHKLPIFTSNFDFAKDVCKDAGTYFDPYNEEDILEKVESLYSNNKLKDKKVERGTEILSELLTWEEVVIEYEKLINRVLNEK